MKNTAVIIGATGAVGKEILNEILGNEYYERIYVLGRNSITTLPDEERLTKIIIDFENINFDTSILENADVFASLGTTIKTAGSKENQRKIDVDYTVNFSKLCDGKIRSFNVVSAIGANSRSKNFYNSYRWRRCAKAYAESKLYICERCHGLKSANKVDGTRQRWVVHHKKPLNPNNIKQVYYF